MTTLSITLRPHIDPNRPTLEAVVHEGYGRQIKSVKVVSEHPVWRGAVLGKDAWNVANGGGK